MTKKLCKICKVEKDISLFFKRNDENRYRNCLECELSKRKQYYNSNSETLKEKYKERYAKNADSVRKKARENIAKRRLTVEGMFAGYKSCAKYSKINFNLTLDEFSLLWQKSCVYCNANINTIGVDRVNSDIGYQIDNIVPCCTNCNLMKSDHKLDDFLNHVKLIYLFNFK